MSATPSLFSRDALDRGGADIDRQLGRLVLTLLDVVRQLMERQAERRVASGTLDEVEIERLGKALLRLADRTDELKRLFGVEGDLDLRLGTLEGQEVGLADVVDRLLDTGVALHGDLALSLADIDLVRIGLRLVAGSADAP